MEKRKNRDQVEVMHMKYVIEHVRETLSLIESWEVYQMGHLKWRVVIFSTFIQMQFRMQMETYSQTPPVGDPSAVTHPAFSGPGADALRPNRAQPPLSGPVYGLSFRGPLTGSLPPALVSTFSSSGVGGWALKKRRDTAPLRKSCS